MTDYFLHCINIIQYERNLFTTGYVKAEFRWRKCFIVFKESWNSYFMKINRMTVLFSCAMI